MRGPPPLSKVRVSLTSNKEVAMDPTGLSVPRHCPPTNGVVRFVPRLLLKQFPESFRERFWAKTHRDSSGCWLWCSTIHPGTGYGRFRTGLRRPRYLTAHRAAWLANFGELPAGHEVRHSCECRYCVNPDHLYLNRMVILSSEKP